MTSTPYYQDENVTLWHGDCREILPGLASVDLVLTDPPYGVGIAAWDTTWPEWIEEIAIARVVALVPGVVNLGRLGPSFGGIPYRWTLNAVLPTPARSPFGLCHWNPCVIYAHRAVSLMRHASDTRRFAPYQDQEPGHPSPKPLSVMRWLVDLLPGDLILDPFAGSGTTLRAAVDNGRKAVGVEIEERYCEIAAKRLAQGVLDFGSTA